MNFLTNRWEMLVLWFYILVSIIKPFLVDKHFSCLCSHDLQISQNVFFFRHEALVLLTLFGEREKCDIGQKLRKVKPYCKDCVCARTKAQCTNTLVCHYGDREASIIHINNFTITSAPTNLFAIMGIGRRKIIAESPKWTLMFVQ